MNSSSNSIHKKFIWKWKISNFASFENSLVPITNYIRNGFWDLVQEEMGKKCSFRRCSPKKNISVALLSFVDFSMNLTENRKQIRALQFASFEGWCSHADWMSSWLNATENWSRFHWLPRFFFIWKTAYFAVLSLLGIAQFMYVVHTSISSLHRITMVLNRNSNCEYVPSSPINSQMVLSDKQNPGAIHIFIIAQWIWAAKRVNDMRCVFATRNMWSDHQKPYSIDKFLSPGLGS